MARTMYQLRFWALDEDGIPTLLESSDCESLHEACKAQERFAGSMLPSKWYRVEMRRFGEYWT